MNSRIAAAVPESELLVRRQFAEFDSLYHRSPHGVGILDREFRYVKVNEALAEFHGEMADALVGRAVHEMLQDPPEDFLSRLRRTVDTNKESCNLELTLCSSASPSGLRYVLAHFYPLNSLENSHAVLAMNMVDITERKIAEHALRGSEARYRDVVEHSVYGVCVVTPQGAAFT